MKQLQKLIPELRLLMTNTEEMLIFFDSHFRITHCNTKACSELGYNDNEIYHLPLFHIFKSLFNLKGRPLKLKVDFRIISEETNAYRKNQTCFPVELSIAVMRKGNTLIGLCSAVNISDKKEMIRELTQLTTELTQYDGVTNNLLANITHELRTPINGILGFTNLLKDTELTSGQLEAVQIIKSCCDNMNILINNLLDYAKLSNNKLTLEQREFNFRDFVRQVIDFHIAGIKEKGLKLVVDISDDIPDNIIGDDFRLAQVLHNLFSNAIKFTAEGQIGLKVIKIPISADEIELFFMLFDTGIGISREEKDKLFKGFRQADSSITRKYGGTGLGLSISKMLIEAMQGRIEVDSEKGKGSTFSFNARFRIRDDYDVSDVQNQNKCIATDKSAEAKMEEEGSLTKSDIRSDELQFHNLKNYLLFENPYLSPMKRALTSMCDFLEKLVICIEMKNWEKAEELVTMMKRILPRDHIMNEKRLLRLLIAIRKESKSDSLQVIKDLEESMLEEK